jgi:hypothetical protein
VHPLLASLVAIGRGQAEGGMTVGRTFYWRGKTRTHTPPRWWPERRRSCTVVVSDDCYELVVTHAVRQGVTNKAVLDAVLEGLR